MVEPGNSTKKRERSPEYPAFDLEEALNKARLLYQAERRNAAPMNAVLKHWDYSPKSGAGIRAVSTLEKFGLIVPEGSGDNRKVRLSEDAFNILVDERPDSPDRLRLIQEAAFKPTAHSELRAKYPNDLPSEDTLRFELRRRGFGEGAANDLMREYRATLAFAKLDQAATLTLKEEDKKDLPPSGAADLMTQNQTLTPTRSIITLPLALGEWAALQADFPLTAQKWDRMIAILDAMKPALVETSAPPKAELAAQVPSVPEDRLSREARQLLETVDKGGVPAYVTPSLEQIATEHGIKVREDTTPNEIIERLRELSV